MSTLRRSAALAPLAAAVLALAGCGSGDQQAHDPATTAASPSSTTSSPVTKGRFAPTDYRYRLRVLCYCPLVGPVDVAVSGGRVASATVATGPDRGKPAPAYASKTINDLLAIDRAKVVWPQGADAPTRVTVDQLRRATDARITYVISQVQTH